MYKAGYYEQAGLLRDMFQNHILQILALIAMEAPNSFDADSVRDEKLKILRSIRPFPLNELKNYIVRGQYGPAVVKDEKLKGYLQEEGVNPASNIETYVAAKVLIDNWRWQGVPFYLRSGKRMKKRVSEIAIFFKRVPHSIFTPIRPEDLPVNTLVLNIQPEEGFSLTIQAKQPGPKLCMGSLNMDFKYADIIEGEPPDAYERLLLDCMLNDQTLFIRSDNIEVAWSLLTPVLQAWEKKADREKAGHLYNYPAGASGPVEADELIERDGFRWREL